MALWEKGIQLEGFEIEPGRGPPSFLFRKKSSQQALEQEQGAWAELGSSKPSS